MEKKFISLEAAFLKNTLNDSWYEIRKDEIVSVLQGPSLNQSNRDKWVYRITLKNKDYYECERNERNKRELFEELGIY